MLARQWLLFEHEGDHEVHLVGGDLAAVADLDLLLLYPGGLEVPEGRGRPVDPDLDGVLEALLGHGTDLTDACDAAHGAGHTRGRTLLNLLRSDTLGPCP